MTEAASLVLKVDATSVDKGAVSLDQLTAASAKTDKATAQLNEQQRRAAEFMKSTATATATAQNTTTQYIAGLEKLIASHDKYASASQAYDNAVRGATKAQKDHIDALIQSTQVHQQSASAVDMLSTAVKALGLSYAAYKVGQYIGEAAQLNAKYELLGVTMAQVGKNVGYTAAQMDMAAEAMQREGINLMASREAAIKMVQAHIDLTNASKLAKLAQDAAIIGNINAEEALLRLTQGIMVGRTQTLKLMGLNVDFELGYRQMADTLHKTTAELSENEKTQSRLNQVMLKGAEIAGANEAAMGTAAKQMILMKSYAEDLKVQLGGVFNETLTVAVLALTKGLEDANGEVTALARNGQLKQWGADVADALVLVADMAMGAAGAFRALGVAAIWSVDTVRNTLNALRHPLDTMFGTRGNEQESINAASAAIVSDIGKSMTAMRDALKDRRQAIEKETELTKRALAATLQYPDALSRRLAQDNHQFPDDKPPPKTTTGGSKSTTISEYERLSDAMEKVTQQAEDEAAANGKLSESDRYLSGQLAGLERAYANGKITMEEWSKLYDKAIDATAAKAHVEDLKAAAKAAEEMVKVQIKAENDLQESKIKSADAVGKQALEMEAANAKLVAEIEMIGKSKEQQDLLTAARLDSVIALKEEEVAGLKNNVFLSKRQILLEDEIKALKERQKLLTQKAGVEQQAAQTKAQLDSQVSMWHSIDSAAQQTFTNVLQGGTNTFDKLEESLKSGLLALLYEMTVKKWIFQIFASVTGGGSALAQAAGMGGGNGVLGMASNASSAYNFVTGGFGNTISSVGNYLGSNAISSFGAGVANSGNVTNAILAYQEAASAATAAGDTALAAQYMTTANSLNAGATLVGGTSAVAVTATGTAELAAGAGLGVNAAVGTEAATGALAAMGPYGWIALAVIAVAAYMGLSGGETRSGASYRIGPDGKAIKTEGPSGGEIAAEQSRGAIEATAAGIQTLMKDLGSSAKLSGFVAGLETSENGKGFAFAGGQINGVDFGVSSRANVTKFRDMNPEEAVKAYAVELQRATIQAVQTAALGTAAGTATSAQVGTGQFNTVQSGMGDAGGDSIAVEIMRTEITQTMDEAARQAAEEASGIPAIIRNMLRDVDLASMAPESITALMNTINALVATAHAISQIGESTAMKNLAGLSFDAANGLATLAGGLDKLLPLLDAAYPILYSEGERAAAAAGALAAQFAALGEQTPATLAELRARIEAIDLDTVAGQALAVALYSLVPAFDAAVQAADSARQQMASALQNFGTSQEQKDFTVETIRLNLANAGLSLTHEQIANASRQDARDLYLAQDPNGPVAAAILANQGAFAGLTSGSNFLNPSSAGGGGGGGASAISTAASDWQRAIEAIQQTAKDLRQGLIETGPDSFAKLKSQFAIETAQAKAGSLSALQDLPTAARALAQAGEANSRTRVEQQRLTAYIINTLGDVAGVDPQVAAQDANTTALNALTTAIAGDAWLAQFQALQDKAQREGTGSYNYGGGAQYYKHDATIQSFAVGSNYIARDMRVDVHEGEEITPRPYVDSQRAARDETNDLLARLIASDVETRKKLDAALTELKDIKISSARTMRVAEKTDATGTPPTRATL